MKTKLFALFILFIFQISPFLPKSIAQTPQPDTNEKPTTPVSIPDATLAAKVRETLNLPAETPLTRADMLQLTELSLSREIKNLTGIEHARNLTYLKLSTNQVSDFTPLTELGNLTNLILSSQGPNAILDLDAITQLTQLQRLSLFGYQVRDLSVLKRLKDLISLDFWYSHINDITPLGELTQLRRLILPSNQIRNITPLRKLTNLELLNLDRNQIRNITPLRKLTQLSTLGLTDNQIRDFTPLTQLSNLTDLRVAGNPIVDKTPLQTLLDQNPRLKIDIDPTQLTPILHRVGPELPSMYWIDSETSGLYHLVSAKHGAEMSVNILDPSGFYRPASAKQTAENVALGVLNMTSLAIDTRAGRIYWIEQSRKKRGEIGSANLDGSDVQQVRWIYSLPLDIAIDPTDRNLYATNTNGKILRLSLDGANFNANFITNLEDPRHIALDAVGRELYWTEADKRIRRANLNGSNVQTVITGLETPGALTVAADKLYWTEQTSENAGKIQRANLDGTNLQTLATLKSVPLGIAVDTNEKKVYWTNAAGRIQRANLNGKNIQNIVTGLAHPIDLVLGTD
ncbi:MAG: leucine-rich repeat domain-containing protein, partial [Candidatus Poribacteria bacterium]|nr:leucine-rich repeat domain-containing protein [Candidatus Poribacteria bacterium]